MKLSRYGWYAAATPVVAYLAAIFTACRLHPSMLFPIPRPARTPALEGASLVMLDDGAIHTAALHAPAPAGAPTIVYFHGNGEQLSDLGPVIYTLRHRGVGVFAIEYPGYGIARGEPTEDSIFAAARVGLTYLRTQAGVAPGETVLLGQSLGTGVAVAMAAEGRGSRVILLSPYTSISDVAHRILPWLPVRWLVRDRFDSLSRAGSVHAPVLVVHGDRDDVIPYDLGQQLATALHARFVSRPQRGHNDLWGVTLAGEEALADVVVEFARGRFL